MIIDIRDEGVLMYYTVEKLILVIVIAAMLATIFTQVQAAEPARAAQAQGAYQQERSRCDGAVEDRKACVREAGAAQQESKAGKLADANSNFEGNKIERCTYLKGDDKGYCIRRMNGEGTVSGSVEGGGIYRELRVKVPAE
jgi:Ni/Co efflux regulator RcnB